MAESLKAVIQLEADPSGVVRGVAGAQRELAKLNAASSRVADSTGVTAGLLSLNAALGYARRLYDLIDQRAVALGAAAHMYSPDAINSQANLQIATMMADNRTGVAIGPYQAAIDNNAAAAKTAEAARVEAHKDSIGAGMVAWGGVKTAVGDWMSAAGDNALQVLGGDFSGLNPFSQQNYANQYLFGEGGGASAVGDEALVLLRQIADSLGGR